MASEASKQPKPRLAGSSGSHSVSASIQPPTVASVRSSASVAPKLKTLAAPTRPGALATPVPVTVKPAPSPVTPNTENRKTPQTATPKPAPPIPEFGVPAPKGEAAQKDEVSALASESSPAATAPPPAMSPEPASHTPVATPKSAVAPQPAQAPNPTSAAPNGFKLPSAVYSPQLLESVMFDLQYYLDWIRQNQIRKTVGAHPKDEPNHSHETVLVIEAWLAGKPATLESIEALLDHLHNLHLPEVHVTLAALPNRTQRVALVEWFRNNTTQDLLMSFVADRNLGGGIVVRTPNRVFDFTWKQQLVAGRDKLAGILKHV